VPQKFSSLTYLHLALPVPSNVCNLPSSRIAAIPTLTNCFSVVSPSLLQLLNFHGCRWLLPTIWHLRKL
jgi:hypothetical protein